MPRIAISNIAWPAEADPEMLGQAAAMGCEGLEVAPSKVWTEPADSTPAERAAFKARVSASGLEIVSLHSLLFSRSDLGLFKGPETEARTLDYLAALSSLAADLGAGVMVFGSPSARSRKGLAPGAALEAASAFFSKAGKAAWERGVRLLIEPLGPEETDFINTAEEGAALVREAGSPGFGLHLDAKSVYAEGEGRFQALEKFSAEMLHFHANDPGLDQLGSRGDYHGRFGEIISRSGYRGWVSIEMRTLPDFRSAVKESVGLALASYAHQRG